MWIAADEDANRGGEDVEREAWKGFEAIGTGVSVAAAGFDLKAWGGQLEVPSDAVQDVGVVIVVVPIPDVGLFHQQPEGFPLQVRRSRQRVPGTIIGFPPTEFRIVAVPFNAWATPEDCAMRELEAQLTRST